MTHLFGTFTSEEAPASFNTFENGTHVKSISFDHVSGGQVVFSARVQVNGGGETTVGGIATVDVLPVTSNRNAILTPRTAAMPRTLQLKLQWCPAVRHHDTDETSYVNTAVTLRLSLWEPSTSYVLATFSSEEKTVSPAFVTKFTSADPLPSHPVKMGVGLGGWQPCANQN